MSTRGFATSSPITANHPVDSRRISYSHQKTIQQNPADDKSFLIAKVHEANMGPIWGRQDPVEPHVCPKNLAIWVVITYITDTNKPIVLLVITNHIQYFDVRFIYNNISISPWHKISWDCCCNFEWNHSMMTIFASCLYTRLAFFFKSMNSWEVISWQLYSRWRK